MLRKAFLTVALVAFSLGTVIGCAKPASKTKPAEKPAATSEKDGTKKAETEKKADAKVDVIPAAQAPPSVSE